MAAKFEETKTINSEKETLFSISKLALEECGFQITYEDIERGNLLAKAKFNFLSAGEDIRVTIGDNGDVTIKSECSLSTQKLDWGKNKKNVKKLFEKISNK